MKVYRHVFNNCVFLIVWLESSLMFVEVLEIYTLIFSSNMPSTNMIPKPIKIPILFRINILNFLFLFFTISGNWNTKNRRLTVCITAWHKGSNLSTSGCLYFPHKALKIQSSNTIFSNLLNNVTSQIYLININPV